MDPHVFFIITAIFGLALAPGSAHAALIAHYTLNINDFGTTKDSVDSASVTLGNRVQIDSSVSVRQGSGI